MEIPSWAPRVYRVFPFLEHADAALREAFFSHAQLMRIPGGKHMCFQGQRCEHLALMLAGRVRVYKTGEEGREITMYRIEGGDSCILSAACILSQRAFPAHAVTETEVEAVAIASDVFRRWSNDHSVWRQHIFAQLVRRLVDVIDVLEDVTFQRLDVRLATYLLAVADEASGRISKTHQAIAADLGSSREVVSRLLKDLERHRLVSLSRGSIALENHAGLKRVAAGTGSV